MRNPERLDKFYSELCEIHKKHFPDWRFGQLLVNVASECSRDFFFPEEDEMIEIFKDYTKKYGRRVKEDAL